MVVVTFAVADILPCLHGWGKMGAPLAAFTSEGGQKIGTGAELVTGGAVGNAVYGGAWVRPTADCPRAAEGTRAVEAKLLVGTVWPCGRLCSHGSNKVEAQEALVYERKHQCCCCFLEGGG